MYLYHHEKHQINWQEKGHRTSRGKIKQKYVSSYIVKHKKTLLLTYEHMHAVLVEIIEEVRLFLFVIDGAEHIFGVE